MAITKTARNKIFSLVQASKRLLIQEVESQLEQYYGIHTDGSIVDVDLLTSQEAERIYTARILRQRLKYIQNNQLTEQHSITDAIRLLVSEEAFTILNRFASLRMAEERNIIKESIRKGYNSEGFQVFDSITGQGLTAEIFTRYTWYLNAVFDELAVDLPSLFERFSPHALIFPSEQALTRLLDILNNEDVTIYREDGMQPVNLWLEDETIGWIYQYYNSKDEIRQMREESDLPRNSRELAVRNQFFTPRYVVQFLTDNSLGRIWYEMTQGKTRLFDFCRYLIRRPDECFLRKGEVKPENHSEDIVYIDYREIKDPRQIKMLDPACGSMHFGLYAFDVYEQIYLEAWERYPNLLCDLRDKFTKTEFIAQIPELIIRHNIHGVDIDPRALQIAGLSLWFRAQKSFDRLQLQPEHRPIITRSNLVLAEPMPGNEAMLNTLLEPLDQPMQQLVRSIWQKMQLAGETGLLLKIEQEITHEINRISKEWTEFHKKAQAKLGDTPEQIEKAKQAAKYNQTGYWQNFLETAEKKVLDILEDLAFKATNGEAYQALLFAEDTQRGFSFIELCRQKYDVILMNPPFGAPSETSVVYLDLNYKNWGRNILSAFFYRMLELINNNGFIGAIFDRTVAIKSSYEDFRKDNFCGKINSMADTGWNVLDANVETTTLVLDGETSDKRGVFIDIQGASEKEISLNQAINSLRSNYQNSNVHIVSSSEFRNLPNSIIGYSIQKYILDLFNLNKNIAQSKLQARDGHNLVSFDHFRVFWEVFKTTNFEIMYNGGQYSLFYFPYRDITKYGIDGALVKPHISVNFRNLDYQKKSGVGYGKRGEIFDAHILKNDMIFTKEGQSVSKISEEDSIVLLSFFNSIIVQYLLNIYAGQHKASGYVNLLPFPLNKACNNDIILKILNLKRRWYSIDETVLEFHHLLPNFSKFNTLKEGITELQEQVKRDKEEYLSLIKLNDDFWLAQAQIPQDALSVFEDYKSKRPSENLISIDGITDDNLVNNPNIANEIISNLLGVAFGRWDIRSIQNPELIPPFGDFFDALPFMPVVSLKEVPKNYPVKLPEDGILVSDNSHPQDISQSILKVIYQLWPQSVEKIENELCEIGGFNSLDEFFQKPTGFFDFHYIRYTKSRREAPIYWPISTPSGSFTIWLYYPKLTDQTLYRVLSNYVQPKIIDVESEKSKLENNLNLDGKGVKHLNEIRTFLMELQDFEKELLRIAQLPYVPNHDDGVLITASPLHNLFRHNKWKKSTEECWKSLEIGEYDWAHLAYTLHPERVRKKCKKDLSMAIAHGLEDICEIKPKEKKATKTKTSEPPKDVQKRMEM